MAYVNVKEWKADQVIEWLKGLDPVVLPYTKNFLNNEMTGEKVLALTSNDLENLGVTIIGHQELLLEAVQKLRNFHYELDKENLQMLALHLSCEANSLYKELQLLDGTTSSVPTSIMSGVHNVILKVKPLVTWLMQTPFLYNSEFNAMQQQLLTLCFELAISANRDRFIDNPIPIIMLYCQKFTELADHMIQDMTDPLILQPAGLNLTTLRKKEQELGLFIFPNYHLVHQIAEFKHGSPAHLSRNLEIGDEIVQVNYQTVVAWQRQNVMLLLRDSPPEVFLTLKKLPQHAKVYGPIYMKPYRLPSKKRGTVTTYSRWNENLPSPRLLTINDLPEILEQKPAPVSSVLEHDSSSDDDTDPPDSPLDGPKTLYPSRSSKPVLQRRNTISGATPSNNQAYPGIEQFLLMYKPEALHTKSYHHIQSEKFDESTLLRDKSASCSNGLESTKSTLRPTTISGISPSRNRDRNSLRNKRVIFGDPKLKTLQNQAKEYLQLPEERSVSVNSLNSLTGSNAKIDFIDEAEDLADRSNMGTDKEDGEQMQEFKNVDVHNIIKKFDEKIILQESNPIINNAVRAKIQNRFVSINETPKNETETKVWEYNNTNSEKTKTIEKETVESSPIIKYELGIPIVETKNSYMIMSRDTEKFETTSDVPPKPPPRSVPHDSYKPKYPADSPKPQIDLTKRKPDPPPRVEERSEGLSQGLDSNLKIEASDECRKFEPKMMSTPVKMNKNEADPDMGKLGSLSVTKSASTSKVSPTNSIVRGLMSNKGKAAKKKNTLTARKRKVSVADVSPGDWEGYLYQRFRPRDGGAAFWDKLWYVLIGNRLYGFPSRDATKAKVLIYLTGFTVSLASEVKSRTNAFKVYHTGTVFYFSADTKEQMTTWIETISEAILRQDPKPEKSILYSETDDSDSEPKTPTEKTSEGIKKFGSLKKFASKKNNDSSHSLDRKWFFNKSTSSKNSVPVPTAQFRSYRKTQATPVESVSTGNFTSHIPNFAAGFTSAQNISVPNLTIEKTEKMYNTSFVPAKNKPKNFNHASNPSLYNLNEFNSSMGMSSVRENFAGCITLEELMKQQKEEQKLNPLVNTEPINLDLIKPDVVYGEVPIRPKEKIEVRKKSSPGFESSSFCFGKKKTDDEFNVSTYPKSKNSDLQHNRSLPRTHRVHPSYDDPAKLKPAGQYTPMMLPMTDDKLNPKMGFELNLDERSNRSGRLKNFFHKSSPKVASPKMGRLMLHHGDADLTHQTQSQASDSFLKMGLPQGSCGYTGQHVDYPGLKYPPVFQPETYSLSDPQGFSNLRKQDKNNTFN